MLQGAPRHPWNCNKMVKKKFYSLHSISMRFLDIYLMTSSTTAVTVYCITEFQYLLTLVKIISRRPGQGSSSSVFILEFLWSTTSVRQSLIDESKLAKLFPTHFILFDFPPLFANLSPRNEMIRNQLIKQRGSDSASQPSAGLSPALPWHAETCRTFHA